MTYQERIKALENLYDELYDVKNELNKTNDALSNIDFEGAVWKDSAAKPSAEALAGRIASKSTNYASDFQYFLNKIREKIRKIKQEETDEYNSYYYHIFKCNDMTSIEFSSKLESYDLDKNVHNKLVEQHKRLKGLTM